ncbi:MAG TPA: hypothetical protein DCM08_02210 [Microscillaceae bacterium]|jgi:predicted metal-dependent hydrolase|nr:hypothetical protein [Microscillaceae bacterium]
MNPQYKVIRKHTKVLKIYVKRNGEVHIVVPILAKSSDVTAWIAKKQAWIDKHLAQIAAQQQQPSPFQLAPHQLLFLGEKYTFSHQPQLQAVQIDDTQRTIEAPVNLLHSRPQLQWYKQEAKQRLTQRVFELADLHGFTVKKVFIRSQRTKWGTCSSLGNIGLNYKLIKTPCWIQDYIILHELAHFRHMNHSPAFWSVVAQLCPAYRDAEKWIRLHERWV